MPDTGQLQNGAPTNVDAPSLFSGIRYPVSGI
jgi:hypothetical protein